MNWGDTLILCKILLCKILLCLNFLADGVASLLIGRLVSRSEQASTSYRQQAALPLGPHSLADAAAKAAPAVVNVTVQRGSSTIFNVRILSLGSFLASTTLIAAYFRVSLPRHQNHHVISNGGVVLSEQGTSSGSGVILDSDGTILTNAHIVSEALPERQRGVAGTSARSPVVHVALQDGRVFEGQVISSDRCSPQADHVPDPHFRFSCPNLLRFICPAAATDLSQWDGQACFPNAHTSLPMQDLLLELADAART